ncbi:glycoside hydrolase 43 family protein [Actinoplanes sichuanensis]|uniref:Family 43 glycosylhydrolase n=1 Tax=Actinoplanes sichuanensis TaxID=512349 RepID=A0ABW4AUX5_9ACTN|nr:glycoside hydrolase 43 family protein [Actinoplanes sichuanensis]BEL04814.1 glycoside hydrolase 43 family protein [Actinoplanes sichuanensis]
MTGRYRNPILHADWSDPDVVRVGDDYFMIASSFHRVPGLPILHSTDLVDWRLIGHALDRLVPADAYRTPRPGCGVWAPALRHHDGRFWICYPDPDYGIYVTTSEDPAGPWSPPRLALPGRGLIDPCPLWDDDGDAYLIHAWAKSRCGFNNRLTAHRMTPDLERSLGPGTVVVDGDAIPGCRTLEGPKWYRRNGWYWIFAPAGGVTNGWQYAMRSRHILGPYQPKVVLEQGTTKINGPHQGAWVETPAGDSWFLHFQDLHAYGRVVHLQPMRWLDSGWPVIGHHGEPVREHPRPALPPTTTTVPAGAAGTSSTPAEAAEERGAPAEAVGTTSVFTVVSEWTWPADPGPGRKAAGEFRPADGVRLSCEPGDDLRNFPAVLGRRLPGPRFRVETTIRLDGRPEAGPGRTPEAGLDRGTGADGGRHPGGPGARAGLVVLGHTYSWIGLEQQPGGPRLIRRTAEAGGEAEQDVTRPEPVNGEVRLAVTVTDGAVAHFAADTGTGWTEIGPPFPATPGGWVGATLGLFAIGQSGHADFGPVQITTIDPDEEGLTETDLEDR